MFLCLLMLAGSTTPLPKTGEEITAEITAARCEQYRPIVEETYELYPVDADLVLAVMAQESSCMRFAPNGGLMQIVVRTWTPTEQELLNVTTNIEWGMYFLYHALHHPIHNPDADVSRGLAAYNCGWVSLDAQRCIPVGGPRYAARVLHFWLPFFDGTANTEIYTTGVGNPQEY